jgi:hypothetical protein
MSEERIREYAKGRSFHPQTLARWLRWSEQDRDALYELAAGLKVGENHLRDLMDWLEEIEIRDRCEIHEILGKKAIADVETDPRLGRADKLKRIKEQVRRLRYPRLSQLEDSIQARIQELNLPLGVRLSVPPGLEGGYLRVEFNASTGQELKRILAQLAEAAHQDSIEDIFRMLAGQGADSGHPATESSFKAS